MSLGLGVEADFSKKHQQDLSYKASILRKICSPVNLASHDVHPMQQSRLAVPHTS